jgi:MFS family permease
MIEKESQRLSSTGLRLNGLAPALQFRNFRLFWVAQILSTIGTSLQVVAEGWLTYEITQSTFWLGMVGFLALLPVVPISLLGGVLIDRFPRRKLILLTQFGLMAQALVFAVLAQSGRIQLPHLILLYFVFGALLAIDHPARRAFLVDLVDRDSLANAVALNGTLFNVSSLVGFAAAGVLIATIGAGGAMFINAATYVAPILALVAINVPDLRHDQQRSPVRTAWMEGFVTLWHKPAVLGAIALVAVVGGLTYPLYGMMPAFAQDVLGTGAVGLGLLLACGALGAMLGTVVVARLGAHGRGRTLAIASLLLPLLIIGFARAPGVVAAGLMMVAAGLVLLIVQSLAITLVQVNVEDRVRGRVMTIYSQIHAGSDVASNVLIGTLAVVLGLPLALALGGVVAFLFAVALLLLLPTIRHLD